MQLVTAQSCVNLCITAPGLLDLIAGRTRLHTEHSEGVPALGPAKPEAGYV